LDEKNGRWGRTGQGEKKRKRRSKIRNVEYFGNKKKCKTIQFFDRRIICPGKNALVNDFKKEIAIIATVLKSKSMVKRNRREGTAGDGRIPTKEALAPLVFRGSSVS